MTPDQWAFLMASYGPGWQTADLLLSDAAIPRAKAGVQGGCLPGDGPRAFYQTTGRGIEKGWGKDGVLVIPWAAFRTHRGTLTAQQLADLEAVRVASTEHERAHPTYYPPTTARRVGPSHDIHPDDRDLYRGEFGAHLRDVVEPWQERQADLAARLVAAIHACAPAVLDDGPLDLLELLALETA